MADDESQIRWWHSIDLGDHWSSGAKTRENVEAEAQHIFRSPVAGKTVLDVGAWDGFFSFEAERLGAARVLATDHFCWSGPGWGTKAGFDYARRCRDSKVESLDIDIPDISPETVGVWDVVLFLGVLYHLKDPFTGLERISKVVGETLIIETVTALNDFTEPVARYYYLGELNNDRSNYWAPNVLCLELMLREIGFTKIDFVRSPLAPTHCPPGSPVFDRHYAFASR
jgi:tRNA (mo5U34)-methyltransferase